MHQALQQLVSVTLVILLAFAFFTHPGVVQLYVEHVGASCLFMCARMNACMAKRGTYNHAYMCSPLDDARSQNLINCSALVEHVKLCLQTPMENPMGHPMQTSMGIPMGNPMGTSMEISMGPRPPTDKWCPYA